MDHDLPPIEWHDSSHGRRLAFRRVRGGPPTLMFLPGYASDMDGAKAVALTRFAEDRGLGLLRFDYSGTGQSPGRFDDGTLASWLDDALMVIDALTEGPLLLAGSSMGGWLAFLAAMRRLERVSALVGIAAAPDFTDWGYTDVEKQGLLDRGRIERSNPYGDPPQLTTLPFWQSGQALRILGEPIDVTCPVRLIHGEKDTDVPLPIALTLLGQLRSRDAQLLVIEDGGHRLSEPSEIAAMLNIVGGLVETME